MRQIYFLLLLLVSFQACQKSGLPEKETLFWNLSNSPNSLDPAFSRDQVSSWICHQLHRGLVKLDDELEVQPDIAYRWEIDSSGQVYQFHLEQHAFHPHSIFGKDSSRTITAHDFVYSFERLIDPELAAPGAWIFLQTVDLERPFEAVDDSTLLIRLKRPFAPFLQLLSMNYASVLPIETAELSKSSMRTLGLGSGPYRLKHWYEGEHLLLEKAVANESAPTYLSVRFVPDKYNEWLRFLKGKLDFIHHLDGSIQRQILRPDGSLKAAHEGAFELKRVPFLNTEYLGFYLNDSSDHPLQNQKVRQALNMGFDRKAMMKYLRKDIGRPAFHGFVPPALSFFEAADSLQPQYNQQKAKKLLAEAGYPEGEGLPVIALATNDGYLDLAIFMQNEWQKLGIQVDIDIYPPGQMRTEIGKGSLNFFRASWIADYADAENYLSLFYSKNKAPAGPNYTHFQNADYDQLYEKAISTAALAERKKLYQQMQVIIMEEVPVIPLFYDENLRVYHKRLKKVNENALQQFNFIDWRLP